METLRPLAQLVHDLDSFDVASKVMHARGGYIMARLYDGIVSNVYKDDAEARRDLYQGKGGRSHYTQLKQRCLRTLSGIVLFLLDKEEQETETHKNSILFCKKHIAVVDLMVLRGQGEVAEKLLSKVYTLSKKYQMTEIRAKACELFCSIYMSKGLTDKMIEKEQELFEAMETRRVEVRLRSVVRRMFASSMRNKGYKPTENEIAENVAIAKSLSGGVTSFDIQRDVFRITNHAYQATGQYDKAYEACKNYLLFLETHPHLQSPARLAEVNIHQAHNCFHMGEYEEGAVCAELAMQNRPSGSDNWYAACESMIMNLTHLEQYAEAKALTTKVLEASSEMTSKPELVNRWYLFDSLLNIQSNCDDAEMHGVPEDVLKSIRKDYAGQRASAMIIDIVSRVLSGDLESLIGRADSIKTYYLRHTKKVDKRATAFLKCLETMIRQNFNHTRTMIMCEPHVEKLKNQLSAQIDQLEIIPYDQLWEIVLDKLKEIQDSGQVYQIS